MTIPGGGSTRSALDIRTESLDGTVALTLSGRAGTEASHKLRAALDALRPGLGQRLHLRLDGLESCDAPVAEELLEFVREAKDGGVGVVLEHRPDPVVSTILRLADVRDDLGLQLDGDGRGASRTSAAGR